MIALDDSPHSEQAVRFVTRMRWPAGSRVIVTTVVRLALPAMASSCVPAARPVDPGRERTTHDEGIVTRAQDRLRASGMSAEGRIVEGDPRERLLRLIESERADLLVVGSRGRTGIVQLVLGSVSSHAVGHAGCSVLVVKHATGRDASGGDDMNRSHHEPLSNDFTVGRSETVGAVDERGSTTPYIRRRLWISSEE